jgi:hypothetical protein
MPNGEWLDVVIRLRADRTAWTGVEPLAHPAARGEDVLAVSIAANRETWDSAHFPVVSEQQAA